MADVYRMPAPTPPADQELDDLQAVVEHYVTRVDVPAAARTVLRTQADAIRRLRVALAMAQARGFAVEAIAAVARDERVAAGPLTQHELTVECEGGGVPPLNAQIDATHGRCPICNSIQQLDGEVMGRHAADPPVRPS